MVDRYGSATLIDPWNLGTVQSHAVEAISQGGKVKLLRSRNQFDLLLEDRVRFIKREVSSPGSLVPRWSIDSRSRGAMKPINEKSEIEIWKVKEDFFFSSFFFFIFAIIFHRVTLETINRLFKFLFHQVYETNSYEYNS